MKPILFLFLIFLLLTSCSGSKPAAQDYYGEYRLIKVRENGKILNIDTMARIEIREDMYISAIDKNGDNQLTGDEINAVAYEFSLDEQDRPYLKINNDDIPVALEELNHFDLLLKRIDNLGNETIMYLKK